MCFLAVIGQISISSLCVCPGFLLLVEVPGAAWRVPGEPLQPGPGAAPDGPHAPVHPLLPEGSDAAAQEAGGDSRRPGGSEAGDRLQPVPRLPEQRQPGDSKAAHPRALHRLIQSN